jgi:RNA polymerase sigma-70 factor (ECF subfamily)
VGTQALTAAAPGNEAARLFEKYGPQLYRFCLGRMRSREEAEDALQSTFLRVHKALAKGAAPEFEAAWLYKIAHNVCLTRHDVNGRRGKYETARDLDEIEYALEAPEAQHDELVGLSDALAVMPPKLRQALLLREWQGLSYAEIAAAMDTTVSAVETLIFRARRHLAGALETDGRQLSAARGISIVALLGRLRALLVGVGPAKLAAGAAIVALGGAGLGTAVALNQPDAWRPPRLTTSPQRTVAVSPLAFEQQTRGAPLVPIVGAPGGAARHDSQTTAQPAEPSRPTAEVLPAPLTEALPAVKQATTPAQRLPVAPPVAVTDVPPVVPTIPAVHPPPVALPAVETPTVPALPAATPTLPALPTVSLPKP